MNVVLSYTEQDALIDILHGDKDWMYRVFGKKTVQKRQVGGFFLQLIANGILVFRLVKNEPKVLLMRDVNDDFCYESVCNWEGFMFRHRDRGSAHFFEDLLRYPTFDVLKMGMNRMTDHNAARTSVSSRNQNVMRQTRMDSFFGIVTNKLDEEDSDDDDEGTTIDHEDGTDEE